MRQGFLKTDWFAPGLRRLLERLSPDVVIPMGRMANCHAGLLATRPRSYKLLSTFRTGRSIPFLYRRALTRSDHIVANSHEALRRLASDYRIHRPDTSSVIYNGCIRDFETTIPLGNLATRPEPTTHNPQPTLHLVSVSMFRPQKKQIRLIRICSQLPNNINWKLTLAGEGPTRTACQAEAHRLGLADRVHFPGLLKDPRSLYCDADIAVHTSDQESLPNFLVEAQMSGLPVVAYDVNGVGETFLHEKSGYLIPHRDQAAFLSALQTLATNPPQRLQFGEAARDHARKKFSLKAQTSAYIRLLSSLA